MIPEWMKETDEYEPLPGNDAFITKSMGTIGKIMANLKAQNGREGKRSLPSLFKLFLVLAYIITVSVTQNSMILLIAAAAVSVILCTRSGEELLSIAKPAAYAALITVILLIPSVLMDPASLGNALRLLLKVILCVSSVLLFSRTTRWDHITGALRKLRIPGVVVFILDITLRFIVLMGNFMTELLTALKLRSVGKNNKKYNSAGGVLGVTFIRGTEMNREMYEAMCSRGFTDDYKGL